MRDLDFIMVTGKELYYWMIKCIRVGKAHLESFLKHSRVHLGRFLFENVLYDMALSF